MSEFKGTPGPWYGKRIPVHSIHFERHNSGLAFVASTGYETKGNADLILAAPDLLEALVWIVNELSDSDEEGLIEHVEPMIKAREAIAKALGKAEQ